MSESLVIEAVRKTVTVDCTVEEAFRVFTSDALSWWPIATHSIHGDAVEAIVFEEHEGGEVYELSANGEKGHWATVVGWEPPSKLVLAWNILEREAVATEVEIRFLPDGPGSRVELEHRGWEAIAEDAARKRSNYDGGWEHILGIFAEQTRS
jgi:uncharacterized protein YndB with AHSA1/START domain